MKCLLLLLLNLDAVVVSAVYRYDHKTLIASTQGLYCSPHKQPGMVNVKQKHCAYENCTNRPSFNFPGEHQSCDSSTAKRRFHVGIFY